MKVKDSGMPDEEMWTTFFDAEAILGAFGIGGEVGDLLEFGCGYGTFTLEAARMVSGMVHALGYRTRSRPAGSRQSCFGRFA